jgi:hypothetical protein
MGLWHSQEHGQITLLMIEGNLYLKCSFLACKPMFLLECGVYCGSKKFNKKETNGTGRF